MTQLPKRAQNRLAKEAGILAAALRVFARCGYSGTSMDGIAAEAGLTKPTLYQYFDSKDRLFTAMMVQKRDDMLIAFDQPLGSHMVAQLYDFARRYADTVMRTDLLSLARLIIGEVQRFPEIGRAYQASGPDQVLHGLIRYLQDRRADGLLEFDDPDLAAQDLWGLILSAPRTQALYLPDDPPGPAEISRSIRNGLRVFLKAYSTHPAKDLAQLEGLQSPDFPTGE